MDSGFGSNRVEARSGKFILLGQGKRLQVAASSGLLCFVLAACRPLKRELSGTVLLLADESEHTRAYSATSASLP